MMRELQIPIAILSMSMGLLLVIFGHPYLGLFVIGAPCIVCSVILSLTDES